MWYYAIDGEKHGPVSGEKVRQLVEDDTLGGEDLVWQKGMDDWQPVSEVEEVHPKPPPLPQERKTPSQRKDPLQKINQPEHTAGRDTRAEENHSAYQNRTSSQEAATEEERQDPKYADFSSRLFAYLIDVLIIMVAGFLTGFFGVAAGILPPNNDAAFEVVGFLIGWMYFALYERSDDQATPGKHIMGLKVTDLQGSKIGFGKATGRHFGKIISGAIFLIGFIMAAFTEKKQALHDMMAGTLVVKDT